MRRESSLHPVFPLSSGGIFRSPKRRHVVLTADGTGVQRLWRGPKGSIDDVWSGGA